MLVNAAGGNAVAFEVFYDATVGYAQALARRMVKPRDLEDLLSDAFFQAWREAAHFDVARGSAVLTGSSGWKTAKVESTPRARHQAS